ncbi:Glutamyl-tRNA(Gln) amidotransferase subunit A [Fusarium oxysporum f. sp. albedinis]|nr:Glutamyl-tRNA(Gln) amidotransferase subunit A [Fusarium oxysporum f. sp. albedinis]
MSRGHSRTVYQFQCLHSTPSVYLGTGEVVWQTNVSLSEYRFRFLPVERRLAPRLSLGLLPRPDSLVPPRMFSSMQVFCNIRDGHRGRLHDTQRNFMHQSALSDKNESIWKNARTSHKEVQLPKTAFETSWSFIRASGTDSLSRASINAHKLKVVSFV